VEKALSKNKYDAVCLTHVETSTGVENPIKEIAEVIKKYPETLFLVDASSSLGGVRVEVDKTGIDVCLAGVQKALAVPPGLSVFSVSKKALSRAKTIKARGVYFDFLEFLKNHKQDQTVSTGPISQMYALDKELNIILKEGLDKRYKRHKEMASMVKKWANTYFSDFAEEGYSSTTLTTILNTRNINFKKLNKFLERKGEVIGSGYGKLKDKTFKISHMGEIYPKDIRKLLSDINTILKFN
jgi:aspartate aminotransferase-like enzyme